MRRFIAVLAVVAPQVATGQDMIFKWVDGKGLIHITDRLGNVPEPYHSLYAAKLREMEERRRETPAEASVPPPSPPRPQPPTEAESPLPSLVEQERRRQKEWREEVAKWRKELEEATAAYEQTQTDLDQGQLNPILRLTPQVQAQIAEIRERRDAALARLERARKMLLVDLPRRAKVEGVPPKWLP